MAFEIEGTLHKKFETEKKTETFQAREFVIVINDSGYDQFIKFQLTQNRCEIIDPIAEGTKIKVHFDLRGREWQGKYFTNLNAWKVEAAGSVEADEQWPDPEDEMFFEGQDGPDGGDDLPF